jgi:FkbH-like protein
MSSRIDPVHYRCPRELAVTDTGVRRILLIGACLAERWAVGISKLPARFGYDYFLIGAALPGQPPRPIADYDFQIVQLPLRSAVPDSMFVNVAHNDMEGHERIFQHAVNRMRQQLANAMVWSAKFGLLTFVFGYQAPQQNPAGRLLPRYDLRNFVYFVEKLNEALAEEIARYQNAYLFDFNELLANHGRRYFQDDIVWRTNHGAQVGGFDVPLDKDRLEPAGTVMDLHELKIEELIAAGWNEILALFRTVRKIDPVKMVVVDLDDTLWRGVAAELLVDNLPSAEGWPIGLWEALSFLRRRGILLGIISKNEESTVLPLRAKIFGDKLKAEDFAVSQINWRTKVENMNEILRQVNILPGSVVYIDDNPAERAAIRAAFPDIRVLGGSPYAWRRILLWAPECQVPEITAESGRRTDMIQAQVAREEHRRAVSREDFLASLNVEMTLFPIGDSKHPKFPRTLELLNKTNQFNTTGRRWTLEECTAHMQASNSPTFFSLEVKDAFTDYGLVIVAVVAGGTIEQFAMSCRVLGLEVEIAAVAKLIEILHLQGFETVRGVMEATERNLPCRDFYQRCGFSLAADGSWYAVANSTKDIPAHISLDGSKVTEDMHSAVSA